MNCFVELGPAEAEGPVGHRGLLQGRGSWPGRVALSAKGSVPEGPL